MTYKSKKKLNRLNEGEFLDDIKKYIKTAHTFYEINQPELKILAKRLHEEYSLKEFYKVFNKLWNSSYKEKSIAIYTLELYKEDYDEETWYFMKAKLKGIKSWDKLDSVSINILGEIIERNRGLKDELVELLNTRNIWFKRMALMSTIPLIRKGDFELALNFCNTLMYNAQKEIQIGVGNVIREISIVSPENAKKLILKNLKMPETTFNIATEHLKELRRMKNIKKLNSGKFGKLMFWKAVE